VKRSAKAHNVELITRGRQAMLRGIAYAGILSAFINLLQMLVPLYMLQVHDRVLNSRSLDTLTMLSVLVAGGLLVFGLLEFLRSSALLTLGSQALRWLNLPLIEAALSSSIREGSAKATQSLRDLSEIRTFFSSGAAGAPLEAIWSPLFMLVLAAFHPIFGVIALVSAGLILSLSIIGDLVSKNMLSEANTAQAEVFGGIGGSMRNAEVIDAMGIFPQLGKRWQRAQNAVDGMFQIGMRRNKMVSAASKTVRYGMQVTTLAYGAILTIEGVISPGVMVAASVLMARTLAPFDSMIENWRLWRTSGAAWSRIQATLLSDQAEREKIALPAPDGNLVVEKLVYVVPGSATPLLKGLDFSLTPGEVLGIIGPSATGKSTLARLMVGVVRATSGGVYLGGHNVATWERASFGRAVGYLPQNVALLDGTIWENIARLGDGDPADVIAAARLAGVHDLIGRLPLGYDTPTGDARLTLSGGQKQRIGIARAVFGNPRLVVFDEPNANLDAEGEQALVRVIAALKANGAMVVVVAHRSSILQTADKLLLLKQDQTWQFGSTSAVAAILGPASGIPALEAS
jgi:ATP-binding cassette, subfamily C, bacterial